MERIKDYCSIVSFDVGKRTGIAIYEENKNKAVSILTLTANEEMLMKDVLRRDAVIRAEIWIIENFMLYPWMAKKQYFMKMDAPRVIGILTHRSFETGVPIQFQNAGTVKPIITDKIIYSLLPYAGKHELDALRHLFYYLKRKGEINWVVKNIITQTKQ